MMQQSRSNSYLFGGNAPYVEELYEAYLDNPGSVPENWRTYFDNLQHVPATDGSTARDVAHAPVVESFAQRAKANAFALKASEADLDGLRGVGPALTARILAQRAQAPFADWADLQRRVKGIRPTTARRLAEQGLTVGGQQPTSQPDSSSGEKRDSAAAQALHK